MGAIRDLVAIGDDAVGNAMRIAGSPKRIQVRRTSGSVIFNLDVRMERPSDCVGFAASVRSRAWSMAACGGAVVNPEEAQTATAPPLGASSSALDRLSAYTSWKKPLRQSMSRNTGRRPPLLSAAAEVVSNRSEKDHCCSAPWPV